MRSGLAAIFLFSATLPISLAAQTPAAADLQKLAGIYTADDGGLITVEATDAGLWLTSGKMRFTLAPSGKDRFTAHERDVSFTFTGSFLTIVEGGRIVATATRGAAPAAPIAAQGANLSQWLDANVPTLLAKYRVPAAAIAYVYNGKVAFTRIYGERRRGEPARADTLFNVASLTKPIAAEVLLRLASAKRIDLDRPMAPDWVDPDVAADPRVAKLTVRMALEHRTGLPNWRSQTANVLSFVKEPGETFRYAGEGYTYAARYTEKRTGTPFETLARQLVFGPMGMRDTAFTLREAWKTRAAYPHDAQGHELWPVVRLDFSAACCLYSTIGDYARFVAGVMRDRKLPRSLAEQRFAPNRNQRDEMCAGDGLAPELCPPRIAMGLGWMIFGYPGATVVNHTGINDGERSAAFFVPERDFGVVILTNGANGAKLIRDVTAATYDQPDYRRLTAYLAR